MSPGKAITNTSEPPRGDRKSELDKHLVQKYVIMHPRPLDVKVNNTENRHLLKGADINIRTAEGSDTLILAAMQSNTRDTVEALLELGADPNVTNKNGLTPLHVVCDPDVARLLLDHGARTNALNAAGESPIDVASRFKETEVLNVLRQYQPTEKNSR